MLAQSAGQEQHPDMKRIIKWVVITLLVLLLVLAVGALALQRWLDTDDFRHRIEQQAGEALGVGIELGRIDVAVWPLPAVVLSDVAVQTQPALRVERVEVRPVWADLLQGRMAPATLIVRHAVLPQPAIDALLALLQKKKRAAPQPPDASMLQFLPHRTVFDGVTWIDARGAAMMVRAEATLDPDALPQALTLQVLKGRWQGARLTLQREGDRRAWGVALNVAGGSVKGRIEWQGAARPGAEFALKGQLQTRDVEVSILTAPEPTEKARATQPLSGRLEASTALSARTSNPGALLDVLQTQSRFTVQKAVVRGVDLARAVKSVGMSRGGETPLDTLAGQVNTQGKAVQLNNLVASSGVLGASGHVAITPGKALSGRVSVDLGAAVGVPLIVGGTVSDPVVTLTRGAMIGAAVGTVLMPGVGTGAGVSVGDKVGEGFKKLFGK